MTNYEKIRNMSKEEIVDVSIMLEQLRYIYKISNREFSAIKKNKIERMEKRLND